MRKVLLYSGLLLVGLASSQIWPAFGPESHGAAAPALKFLTMVCLGYLMIHVGREFEIDKSNLRQYGWDYAIAATAAAFPWIFTAAYFVFALGPTDGVGSRETWVESLLVARFSAPTSAGILFSMLAAAGLAATWVYRKARVLAIFDDLDTVLFMIPLKILVVGMKWQLAAIAAVIFLLLWAAWKYYRRWKIPTGWNWTLAYAAGLAVVCEAIYLSSRLIDEVAPVHLEVLLPAFALGCAMAAGHEETRSDHRAGVILTAAFMVLVGLSMPALRGAGALGWGPVLGHVLAVTVLSNLGKMFSVFCYRREASWRERLAVSIGMFPRGEVGAGVLVVSLSYGIDGPAVTVAMLSLALNLVLTGVFIAAVKKLIPKASFDAAPGHGPSADRNPPEAA